MVSLVGALGTIVAANMNNEANAIESSGDLPGAERKFLEALQLKIAAAGEDSIGVALVSTPHSTTDSYLILRY